MHVVVLGAGVIGVTTAHALLDDGHEVTLIEAEDGPACGASHANAGQISPALSAPWAVPGLAAKAVGWMFAQYPPLRLGKVPDLATLGWLLRMFRAANAADYDRSKRAMVALGTYSRERLAALRAALPIDYAGAQRGTFVLFRKRDQAAAYERDLDALAQLGVAGMRIDLDTLQRAEPNLDVAGAGIVGAVHLPGDETGDCRRFTTGLLDAIADRTGFRLLLSTRASGLQTAGDRVRAVSLEGGGSIAADAVICCLGVGSSAFLRMAGLSVPVAPLKGYSLTIPADSAAVGPLSTVSDETYKVGVTYLRDRIRVGGTAELAGFDTSRPEPRYAGLLHVVRTLFPTVPEKALEQAERWSGLRPMTPDGPPILGQARLDNLFLHTGHGTLGWTMACGSAAVTADLLAGRRPAIDMAPFSPLRFAGRGG